jgi:hypothetical protein
MNDQTSVQTTQSNHADEYRERYVALLDLLGFKELVKNAETNQSEHENLIQSLNRLRDTLCNHPAIDMRFSFFSDTIIVTAEHSPQGLWQLLTSICTLTRNLLQNNVLVRGGMTRGRTLHNEQFVYGTAVSRAAIKEKEEAKNPLTLLSSEVYEDAKANGQQFLDFLEEDEDKPGSFFVHYLLDYAEYDNRPRPPGTVILDDDAARIVHFISRRLQEHIGGVLEKAQWFQSYWNCTVARPGGFAAIQSGIVPECPKGPRTIIARRLVASGNE